MIDIQTQNRIVKYFKRLDEIKPSEFDRNFPKEWAYLRALSEMVLRPKGKKSQYQVYANQIRDNKSPVFNTP